MARITIEKCLKKIPNRYDLVRIASKRAHALYAGGAMKVENTSNDAYLVVALREIEKGVVDHSILTEMDRGATSDYEQAFKDLANKAEDIQLQTDFSEEDTVSDVESSDTINTGNDKSGNVDVRVGADLRADADLKADADFKADADAKADESTAIDAKETALDTGLDADTVIKQTKVNSTKSNADTDGNTDAIPKSP